MRHPPWQLEAVASRLHRTSPAQRSLGVASGILAGVALGVVLGEGDIAAALAILIVGGAVLALARLVAPPAERTALVVLVLLTFALHVATVTLLHAGSVAIGRGGAITGDDGDYARIAWYIAQYLRGDPHPSYVPPDWGGEDYIVGTWAYLEGALFYVFGPQVLLAKIINAGLMTAVVVFAYDIGRRLFGRRQAFATATLVAFYPSLVLWSSLNLKDALVLLIVTLVFWTLVLFQFRPRWWALLVPFLVLLPMADLRRYIFLGLALIVPIAVVLAPPPRLRARILWTGAAIALSALLLATTRSGTGLLGPQLLTAFEVSRQAMASGARTSFAEPRPLIVTEGSTFVVPTDLPTTTAPAIVHVGPSTRIVILPPSGPEPASRSGLAFVRPGDVVVVGPPGTTARPNPDVLSIAQGSVQLTDVETMTDRGSVAARTLDHLPKGLAYALFAPFPWALRRPLDVLTVPEMLAWYVIVPVALWSTLRARGHWPLLAPLALYVGGTVLTLALAEGNVGTLYRHRAMVIPYVILLASPGLSELTRLIRSAAVRTVSLRRSDWHPLAGAGPARLALEPGDHRGEAKQAGGREQEVSVRLGRS